MEPFQVIIPARYASSRLPGKPLLDLGGKPLVQRVVESAIKSGAEAVCVATDDVRIQQAVEAFGGKAVMTSPDHLSGSDRIAEAAKTLGLPDERIIVNVQGDEPDMPPALIDQVASLLAEKGEAVMATASAALEDAGQLTDPSVVKVVTDRNGYALYFSRATIPWVRGESDSDLAPGAERHIRRHIGIYAYRASFIREFSRRPPSPLEQLEKLEQLRALWQGEKIACAAAVEAPAPGIDTEADLARTRRRFGEHSNGKAP
ncbi:MAG: 3-deoxy-manno-octulosonate cytidylyltransferase [Pseudomonadota bacterium]|nr:3-deoxy-manno-octulosonate cytidylyltransferase [Pseudomonadota bacterium]